MRALALVLLSLFASPAIAATPVNPLIDYPGFVSLTGEVKDVRSKRLVPLERWSKWAKEAETLILDARSERAFKRGHIAGAVNLPFSDFTAEALAQVVGPDRNRRILIYCNNNFTDNRDPVVTKSLPLALNIPTFINLVGYGYRNVWELGEAVSMADTRLGWVAG